MSLEQNPLSEAPQNESENRVPNLTQEKAQERFDVQIPAFSLENITPEQFKKLETVLKELDIEVGQTNIDENSPAFDISVPAVETHTTREKIAKLEETLGVLGLKTKEATVEPEPVAMEAVLPKPASVFASDILENVNRDVSSSSATVRGLHGKLKIAMDNYEHISDPDEKKEMEEKIKSLSSEMGKVLNPEQAQTEKSETLQPEASTAEKQELEISNSAPTESKMPSAFEAAIARHGTPEEKAAALEAKEKALTQAEQEKVTEEKNVPSSYEAALARHGGEETIKNGEQKIEPTLTNEVAPKKTMEQMEKALETQNIRLKKSLLERGLHKLENSSVLERYRNVDWKKKVALGVLLGTAGAFTVGTGAGAAVLAAGVGMRMLGTAATYVGFIERAKNKKAEAAILVDENGNKLVPEITQKDRYKALGYTALLSLLLPQVLKTGMQSIAETETAQEMIGWAGDKAKHLFPIFKTETPIAAPETPAVAPATPEAVAPEVPPAVVVAGAATAINGTPNLEVLSGGIQKGDTMYSVLKRMVPDISKLEGGRQTNAIENLISKMKDAPGGLKSFGIMSGDANMIQPGETINADAVKELLSKSTLEDGSTIIEHAKNLTEGAVKRIELYTAPAVSAIRETATETAATAPVTEVSPIVPEAANTQTMSSGATIPEATPEEALQPQVGQTLQSGTTPAPEVKPFAPTAAETAPGATPEVVLKPNLPISEAASTPQGPVQITQVESAPRVYISPTETVASTPVGVPQSIVTPTGARIEAVGGAAAVQSFNLNQIQLQALNAKENQLIEELFKGQVQMRQDQGMFRNLWRGFFTGTNMQTRQIANSAFELANRSIIHSQEVNAAHQNWMSIKDMPAQSWIHHNTPGPLNLLKVRLGSLSMGIMPEAKPGETIEQYTRNIIANAIKSGRQL